MYQTLGGGEGTSFYNFTPEMNGPTLFFLNQETLIRPMGPE